MIVPAFAQLTESFLIFFSLLMHSCGAALFEKKIQKAYESSVFLNRTFFVFKPIVMLCELTENFLEKLWNIVDNTLDEVGTLARLLTHLHYMLAQVQFF